MQAKGPSGDKAWWAQKTNPSFPAAPMAAVPPPGAAPKQNPFLKGGAAEETKVRDAPHPGDGRQKQGGDQKNPRKEFEAGLMGAVCGLAVLSITVWSVFLVLCCTLCFAFIMVLR